MNDIEKKLNELLDLISNQDEISEFKEIEKNLLENQHINKKLNEFKKIQKKITLYEYHNNTLPLEYKKSYENSLNNLLNIPIFNKYINLQSEINDIIQQITFMIEQELNDK